MHRASYIHTYMFHGHFYFTAGLESAKSPFPAVKNSYFLRFLIPTIIKLMTWNFAPSLMFTYLQFIMAILTLPTIWGPPNRRFWRLKIHIYYVFSFPQANDLKFCTQHHIYTYLTTYHGHFYCTADLGQPNRRFRRLTTIYQKTKIENNIKII